MIERILFHHSMHLLVLLHGRPASVVATVFDSVDLLLEKRVPLFGASTSGQQGRRTVAVDEHRQAKGRNGESERGINGGSRTCFHGSPRDTCSFAD